LPVFSLVYLLSVFGVGVKKQKSYQSMADNVILVDTSILIDYYRKTDKVKSAWINLIDKGYEFAISVITKYELYSKPEKSTLEFDRKWEGFTKMTSPNKRFAKMGADGSRVSTFVFQFCFISSRTLLI
jgi:hypothetical protein